MFNNNAQRNFEWFEASFSKRIQQIIDESNRDNASWIRDLFISILLTILPLACELISDHQATNQNANTASGVNIIQTVCTYGVIISMVGLLCWIIYCIWKYNKAVQRFKNRVIPHTIKGYYSIEECVHYFDNDVCNDLILSKHYIELAKSAPDSASIEFYFIEALHYYYKSIRIFTIICNSHEPNQLTALFKSNRAGTDKCIDIVRLVNYLSLISSIQIPAAEYDPSLKDEILEYNTSFGLIVTTFDSIYHKLQGVLSPVSQFASKHPTLIRICNNL